MFIIQRQFPKILLCSTLKESFPQKKKSFLSESFTLLSLLLSLQVASTGVTDGGFVVSLLQLLHDILSRNL